MSKNTQKTKENEIVVEDLCLEEMTLKKSKRTYQMFEVLEEKEEEN